MKEWLAELRGVQIYRSHSRENIWMVTAMVVVWNGEPFSHCVLKKKEKKGKKGP